MKPLAEYTKKRDFKKTAEPKAKVKKSKTPIFVVQEHHASHLHYDFRLEMDGVLKSWAVPKGPSLDPAVKRLAVEVEDHPLDYAGFAGEIPKGEYGGGTVYIWDTGAFLPVGDGLAALKKGRLEFTLKGKKLKGAWILVRTGRPSSKPQWLLIKRHDNFTGEADLVPIARASEGPKKAAKKAPKAKAPAAKKKPKKRNAKAVNKKDPLPEFLIPQLAQLVEVPPEGEPWIHELKYDGYRIVSRVSEEGVQLFTRNKHDWTAKYPSIRKALEKIAHREAYLDGELVWVNEDGTNDFQRLSNLEERGKSGGALGYFIFDLPFLDGEDLRDLPLLARKEKLAELLTPLQGGPIVYSGHMIEGAADFLKASCNAKLEGIISKDGNSRYVSGRRDSWVKAKCQLRQEFVIGGFTKEQGSRVGFGALLLGVADDDGLRFVGKVGTGFNRASLLALRKKFSKLQTSASPFTKGSPAGRGVQWIKPVLVTEVSFANWTNDQHLRAPVFHGLRGDKPASDVSQEKAAKGSGPAAKAKPKAGAIRTRIAKPAKAPKAKKAAINQSLPGLTHGEKIIYPKENLTKEDLRDYYVEVAPLLLPHIANRPLSLLRCPAGVGAACFMQKHLNEKLSPGLHAVEVPESSGNTEYVAASSAAGLAALVQKNVIELHAMGSRAPLVEKPDLIVMDFDPAPDVSFKEVVAAARELREILSALGLESFVKVTGGKGLHVHVPCAANHGWEKIKAFAHAIAREMANRQPKRYTTQMAKAARTGKIFLDYLRNGEGATAVVPYSLRAKPISAVAMPVEWKDLCRLKGADQFTLPLALAHVKKRKRDPWENYFRVKQKLALLG